MSDNSREFEIDKKRIFPNAIDKEFQDKLMIDRESLMYISIPEDAEVITNIICRNLDGDVSNMSIVDATSGVGGNVISFAKRFKLVYGIELDKQRFEFLKNNIDAYELKNVILYNDNCLDVIKVLKYDVIFFDPPWGGKLYKEKKKLNLMLSGIPLEEICGLLMKQIDGPKIIGLKLPKNYDLKQMYDCLSSYNIMIKILLFKLKRMNILVIKKTQSSELMASFSEESLVSCCDGATAGYSLSSESSTSFNIGIASPDYSSDVFGASGAVDE